MDQHRETLTIRRIERLVERIRSATIIETVPFELTASVTDRIVPWSERADGQRPIAEGDLWGMAWQSAWFRCRAAVPEGWDGKPMVALIDLGGEALLFNDDGTPREAFSGGSIYDPNFVKTRVLLEERAVGGRSVELWIEAAANAITGISRPADPAHDDPERHGTFRAVVTTARLGLFCEASWHLFLDVDVLLDLAKALPGESVRRARILLALSEAADLYRDERINVERARARLAPLLAEPAEASALSTVATGHAHIDTAWLWPTRETVRKCARTFANQLRLIERYPEYIFGASQPQHYRYVKDHYPALFDEIRRHVASGRWEVQGGMWVEADCNLVDGESLVRQIMHGKAFFMREFGVEVKNVWLPDVFGYSAALPQIMRKAGIDSFLTQKISWSQFNRFPYHTFWWRGIDGSAVLAHFPPEDSYNSPMRPTGLMAAQNRFAEKDRLESFMTLYGVGDGGGGPVPEYVERARRMENTAGLPPVRHAPAQTFFDTLHADSSPLPTWAGELYLEFHRGTLTTQGAIKRGNRKLEQALGELEALATVADAAEYPREALDRSWKTLLLNQFHDIIPGSSINEVYRVTRAEHAEALETVDRTAEHIAGRVLKKRAEAVTLFNSLSTAVEEVVPVAEVDGENGARVVVREESGAVVPSQTEGSALMARIALAPGEVRTLTVERSDAPPPGGVEAAAARAKDAAGRATGDGVHPGAALPAEEDAVSSRDETLILENDAVRYEFAPTGRLVSAYDKRLRWEVVPDGRFGNALTLYDDRPNNWDAWDIDIFYEEAIVTEIEADSWSAITGGDARIGITFTYSFGGSRIEQRVSLRPTSARLDFDTRVEWYERHRMLRVAFPTTVLTDHGSFDVQYGYVRRPNHRNTSWDMAKFESVGQRYADLSQPDRGVALLNDCKYGYKVLYDTLDLNLLRSPANPDPDADRGEHRFVYALLPHSGPLATSDVMDEAASLNRPPRVFAGYAAPGVTLPVAVDSRDVGMTVLKRAEESDALVVRLVERRGTNSTASLVLRDPGARAVEIDLLERKRSDAEPIATGEPIAFTPFEIRTFRIEG